MNSFVLKKCFKNSCDILVWPDVYQIEDIIKHIVKICLLVYNKYT